LLDYYNIEPTETYEQADLDKFAATHNLTDYFLKKPEDAKNAAVDTKAQETIQAVIKDSNKAKKSKKK
jgi:glycine cleavage system protein P-like pyridoxal-binding family